MMLSQRHMAFCGFALLLLAGGAGANDELLERGAEILLPFKQELKAALVEGMQQGPAEAIGACRMEAPKIAESLSVDGVAVGRTSHRLRNPTNTGPLWAEGLLDSYLSEDSKLKPFIARLEDGRIGYAEPIMVQPLCLACHGETLAPEIRLQIDELYPEDAATGFKVGDLRGIFWAEFPAKE